MGVLLLVGMVALKGTGVALQPTGEKCSSFMPPPFLGSKFPKGAPLGNIFPSQIEVVALLGPGVTTGETVNRPLQQSSPMLRRSWHQLPIAPLAHHPTPRTQRPTSDPVRIRVSIGPRRPLLLAGGPPASLPRLWVTSPRLARARSTLASRTMAPPTDESLTKQSEAPPPGT